MSEVKTEFLFDVSVELEEVNSLAPRLTVTGLYSILNTALLRVLSSRVRYFLGEAIGIFFD